ncbi:MAG: peptidylprolyl isomerase [Phycisphaerales bacterium]
MNPRNLILAARWVVIGAALAAGGCGLKEGTATGPGARALAGPVQVEMVTTRGTIVVELDIEHAPVSVANFLGYVDGGAYDGTVFHRVIPQFVVQGGGHSIDLTERPGGAAIVNEWQNGLKNVRGTIAMARDAEPDTAKNQFYFNVVDNPKLDTARAKTGDAGYAVFGRVVRGMDVLDAIRVQPTSARPEKDMLDVPVEPVVLRQARRVGPAPVVKGS